MRELSKQLHRYTPQAEFADLIQSDPAKDSLTRVYNSITTIDKRLGERLQAVMAEEKSPIHEWSMSQNEGSLRYLRVAYEPSPTQAPGFNPNNQETEDMTLPIGKWKPSSWRLNSLTESIAIDFRWSLVLCSRDRSNESTSFTMCPIIDSINVFQDISKRNPQAAEECCQYVRNKLQHEFDSKVVIHETESPDQTLQQLYTNIYHRDDCMWQTVALLTGAGHWTMSENTGQGYGYNRENNLPLFKMKQDPDTQSESGDCK